MWHQLEPEGHLVGTVVVSYTWFQANVKVLLVLRAEFSPHDLLEAVWLRVDELGVLGNWDVWVSERTRKEGME